MEQFLPVRLAVYNCNSNNITTVKKQELPKCKPDQSHTYQKRTKKKGFNKKFISSATPSLNKMLEFPRKKLSKSNTMLLDAIETGLLLREIGKHLKRKDVAIPKKYVTLLDAVSITPDVVINSHDKAKERGDWIFFRI